MFFITNLLDSLTRHSWKNGLKIFFVPMCLFAANILCGYAQRVDNITELLVGYGRGDKEALDKLMPIVYDELRRQAARYLRKERPGHTLQTTALIHEAYVR